MSSRTLAGRYELLEKIGDGGMAFVYKARCKLLNRYVAVKILKPEFTKDVTFIENFRRESQAAASLSHPNIVNVYDVGREGNINYIVMELVEGKVLSDIIKEEGFLPVPRALSIVKQIASALSHAHKNQIIHRDVKPHNILITEDGAAKITDFGIAKAVNAATIIGHSGTVMGSVHYFSPEQARGAYVDEKSDIYSLGIVLYEMLTGKVPFDADNPVAVAMKHLNEEMTPPSRLREGIPKDVEAIVLKASEKYQTNRYRSADEMLEALNQAEANLQEPAVSARGSDRKSSLDSTMMMKLVNSSSSPEDREAGSRNTGDKVLKGKKKFRLNKAKVLAIVLALVFAFPASQFLLSAIEAGTAPEEVNVPKVIGMSVDEAAEALKEFGLELAVDKTVYNSEYESGLIVSQDPDEGMPVKSGKTVKVNVSKGTEDGTVPNVVGKTLSDGVFILESYGYAKGGVSEEYSELPMGIIIRQTPDAGSKADSGARVSLVVSLGQKVETTTVPKLIGFDVDAAKAALEREKLALGSTDYAPSYTFAPNIVIEQSVTAGSAVDTGTPVNITISTGPDESAGSVVVQIPISYQAALNEVFYLTIMVSDSSGVTTPINYQQRLKSNGSEMFSVTGTGKGSVKIYFDNTLVQEHTVDFDTGETH